jgi:hypothetical protein
VRSGYWQASSTGFLLSGVAGVGALSQSAMAMRGASRRISKALRQDRVGCGRLHSSEATRAVGAGIVLNTAERVVLHERGFNGKLVWYEHD